MIRRILRRAVRYGFSYLNFKEPFLYKLVPILADQLKDVFTELHQQLDYVSRVVHEEEISFLRTLEKGLKRMETIGGDLKDKVISGEVAFELYDTFGFPLDLTSLIARERGLSVDEKGFPPLSPVPVMYNVSCAPKILVTPLYFNAAKEPVGVLSPAPP